uniref:Tripartite motif containing 35-1 n=1 Tax=Astyanax mexicanus TaxID=7994 RepID=A0A8B9JLL9_ASTMX
MASSLEHDLSCPLCSKLYQDPQLLSCGHSFCRRCLNRHFPVHLVRICCSVCHQVCPYKPVANLVLRNTCESYLREKELERENDAGVRCSLHGKEMSLFCETDHEVICSKCKRDHHNTHNVQPLTHAVHQRKRQVKAALCPAEKALESQTFLFTLFKRFLPQYQAQWSEGQMKKDFEKLRQFLKEEEVNRVAALREEEQRKTEKVDESVEQIQSLWDNVRKVEDTLEDDDVLFLCISRAQNTIPGRDPDYEVLINVGKHLGNLRYNVCEKMMKNLCPHYPITLDPNTTPAGFSISDDLAGLQKSTHERRPFTHLWKTIVLGSEGYTNGFQCWDVSFGDSNYWTIGVCRRKALQNQAEDLSPRNGFWGISCVRDSYKVLGSTRTCGSWWNWWNLMHKPGTVRVKLGQNLTRRTVSFYNATKLFLIASIDVPAHEELFPFLIPEDSQSLMRIVPDDVTVKVKDKFNIIRRFIDEIVLAVFVAFAMLFFYFRYS